MTIKNILNMIISFFKNILNKKKLFIKIGISLSLLASTVIAVSYLFNMIEKFGPSGETKEKTAIFVQFSLPVKIVKDKANGFHFFKITPAIEGSYEFPDERTIMFVPAEPLRPSASYSVTTDLAYIKSKKKIFGKTFTFFTAPFQLLKSSVFFTYHPVTGIEREAVAELDFNYPVEHAELLKFISLTIEGSPAVFRLENSVSAGRYYIKTAAPERENKTKEMSLMLREGLSCIDGVNPLAASKTIKLVVPKKDLLEIEKTEMHYAEGFSLVSILFNYPVASENLQNNISIIPELPFKIETEYRYAVIKADFLPNIEYKISIAKGLESRGKHVLSANYQRNIRIKDRDPEVKFADQASLVPLRGQLNLRYYAVNLDKVNFSVFKIFKNNLVPYLRSSHEKWLYGQEIDSFEKAITGELNVKNYNTINLSEYRKSQYTGLYQIEIRDNNYHYNRDNSTFLVSDIGMVSKRFGDDG
ncbi:MAG TPA: hypothetical protein DC049_07360, partial [Spirochaetia bacterium]|nr:hypothetical protein [Spirochaetia bacterium]